MHIARLMAVTAAVDCDAAPPRTALRLFGGHLDLDAFRSTTRDASSAAIASAGEAAQGECAATAPPKPRGTRPRGADGGHMRLEQLGFVKRT